ncbi:MULTISPECIES: pyridoxamine 5'-phosphate oxidase family protein [unclassified Blastococcus]
MPPPEDPAPDVLSPDECRRLLTSVSLGRLAFTIGALPTIQPVHFTVRGDEVLVPTRRGGEVEAASRGAVVAFEIDDLDAATGTVRSVTVVGPSRVLADAEAAGPGGPSGPAPGTPGPDTCVVAIRIARISGRRLGGGADVPAAPGAGGGTTAEAPPEGGTRPRRPAPLG